MHRKIQKMQHNLPFLKKFIIIFVIKISRLSGEIFTNKKITVDKKKPNNFHVGYIYTFLPERKKKLPIGI